jgi:hypothetical protein
MSLLYSVLSEWFSLAGDEYALLKFSGSAVQIGLEMTGVGI